VEAIRVVELSFQSFKYFSFAIKFGLITLGVDLEFIQATFWENNKRIICPMSSISLRKWAIKNETKKYNSNKASNFKKHCSSAPHRNYKYSSYWGSLVTWIL